MTSVYHYHTFSEAEEIRQTYSSWMGKRAHTGKGMQEILKNISIKCGSSILVGERYEPGFYLEFEFENRTLNVYEFTVSNGLRPITGTLSVQELRQQSASQAPGNDRRRTF